MSGDAMRLQFAPVRIVGRLDRDAAIASLQERITVAKETGTGSVPRLWGVQELVEALRPHLLTDRQAAAVVAEAVRLGLARA
jgi:hypothetical protein